MIVFKGNAFTMPNNVKLFRTWILYDTFFTYNSDGSRFCGAMCNAILTDECYREDEEQFPAWGYDGKLPDLLSVGMLAFTLGNVAGWRSAGDLFCYQYLLDDYGNPTTPKRYSWVFRRDVLRYYRDFTKEITSKFGDSWTITSDEVRLWLKSKGYQEAIKKEEVVA